MSAENSAYELKWPIVGSGALPDLTGLPSLDYALYLANTVKFHACQLLRLFDEEEFLRNMHEFYMDGPAKVNSSRLWFVQYLLVIALGKGFSVTVRVQGTPPGSVYFQRAMGIMPDFVTLTREPFLAIEVLCMAAVYLMSVDMKNAAYGYVSSTPAGTICRLVTTLSCRSIKHSVYASLKVCIETCLSRSWVKSWRSAAEIFGGRSTSWTDSSHQQLEHLVPFKTWISPAARHQIPISQYPVPSLALMYNYQK